MKPTFKTTAVAILAALGVTACSSGGGDNGSNSTSTPISTTTGTTSTGTNSGSTTTGTDSTGTNSSSTTTGTNSTGTDSGSTTTGTDSTGTNSGSTTTGTDSAGTNSGSTTTGIDSTGTNSGSTTTDTSSTGSNSGSTTTDTSSTGSNSGSTTTNTGSTDTNSNSTSTDTDVAAEKEANKWRSGENSGSIYEPRPHKPNYNVPDTKAFITLQSNADSKYELALFQIGYSQTYTDTPAGVVKAPVFERSNEGVKLLDYYELAKKDVNNPNVLGVHKGSITSGGINGAEVTAYDDNHRISATRYPEKVDYLFINTPYTTYGAVYNENAVRLFASSETDVFLGTDDAISHPIGDYEVVDGNKTTKIVYNDAVKGSATYKGQVIAVPTYKRTSINNDSFGTYIEAPSVDGTITLNANFGSREEQNYIAGTLDSKLIGKTVALPKTAMNTSSYTFAANKNLNDALSYPENVYYDGKIVGKDASGVQGSISYVAGGNINSIDNGKLIEYNAVFAAEKQAK